MTLREQIVRQARSYLGTRFHHQGRLRGVGIDCVGVLVCVAKDLGIECGDCRAYSMRPDGKTLQREMAAHCVPIKLDEAGLGDILVFRYDAYPCHVGIKTDKGVIHTYRGCGSVVEHGLREPWLSRLCGAYRFKGVV